MARNDYLLNELDRKFADRDEYNKQIAIRKVELTLREQDDNIGGGSSGFISNPTAMIVIKAMTDPYIQNRELWKKAINQTVEEQSDDIRRLIELKYWGEDSWMDWTSFGEKHGYAKRTIYRIRQRVLLDFGRKIGEIC